jgi:hypothetical protein
LGKRRIKDEEPKQKERKNERKGLTLTGLLMEGVSHLGSHLYPGCWVLRLE